MRSLLSAAYTLQKRYLPQGIYTQSKLGQSIASICVLIASDSIMHVSTGQASDWTYANMFNNVKMCPHSNAADRKSQLGPVIDTGTSMVSFVQPGLTEMVGSLNTVKKMWHSPCVTRIGKRQHDPIFCSLRKRSCIFRFTFDRRVQSV